MSNKPNKLGLKFWHAADVLKETFFRRAFLCRKWWHAEFRRERVYWCCYEANGPDFPGRFQCHMWWFFHLTWPGTVNLWKDIQCCWSNATNPEVPEESKKKNELYKTEMFRFYREMPIMPTLCQCKSKTRMPILSNLHADVQISNNKKLKKQPNSIQ